MVQGLSELGYREGKSNAIERGWAAEKVERFHELAAELVRLNIDAIVANGTAAVRAAQKATQSIPIVAVVGDPVGTGLVTSLARPGGNITGLTILAPDLSGKRLELLKEFVPKLSRVAVMFIQVIQCIALNYSRRTMRRPLTTDSTERRSLGFKYAPGELHRYQP